MPPARRACSRSRSVREERRPAGPLMSLEATGWRPDGNEEGGTGDRGECCLKKDARMEDGQRHGGLSTRTSPSQPKARLLPHPTRLAPPSPAPFPRPSLRAAFSSRTQFHSSLIRDDCSTIIYNIYSHIVQLVTLAGGKGKTCVDSCKTYQKQQQLHNNSRQITSIDDRAHKQEPEQNYTTERATPAAPPYQYMS